MVEGTDPVATLPAPIGKLTYNEWHAAIMGIATAILPTLTLILSYGLYYGEDRIAGLVFASGALTYAGGFIALATIARFLDGVPVLRESWYFLFTYISVLLVGTRIGISVV
jgi:hypothetical protein